MVARAALLSGSKVRLNVRSYVSCSRCVRVIRVIRVTRVICEGCTVLKGLAANEIRCVDLQSNTRTSLYPSIYTLSNRERYGSIYDNMMFRFIHTTIERDRDAHAIESKNRCTYADREKK